MPAVADVYVCESVLAEIGVVWEQGTEAAPWAGSSGPAAVFNSKLWMLGGWCEKVAAMTRVNTNTRRIDGKTHFANSTV